MSCCGLRGEADATSLRTRPHLCRPEPSQAASRHVVIANLPWGTGLLDG